MPEYEFPVSYNEDYLILLVRDPNCLYAYWELSSKLLSSVNSRFNGEGEEYQLILRVYDLTGLDIINLGFHSYFDIRIHPMADNYFIDKIDSNRSYYVELGCYEPGGDFVGIIKSNVINTPRNSVANGSHSISSRFTAGENSKKPVLIDTFASLGIYGDSSH